MKEIISGTTHDQTILGDIWIKYPIEQLENCGDNSNEVYLIKFSRPSDDG